MKTFFELREAVQEKTLTPAEKKKREEIAQAMERDNPGMDKSKKMAIATASAKKVEAVNIDELSSKTLTSYMTKASSQAGKTNTPANTQDKRIAGVNKAMKKAKEEVEIEEAGPKIKPDFLKVQRAKDAAHNAAMGRTATGRKKPVRTMTSTQRSMASMNKEEQ